MEYGLIGKSLGHSYSKEIHAKFGLPSYELKEVKDLDEFMREKDFKGINVTIPYKIEAMKYCGEVSDIAKKIGCVNTIIKREDGTLFGDNTDYAGFLYMVENSNVNVKNKQCLLLGSGGASRCAVEALKDLGAGEVITVSRSGSVNYENIYDFHDANIICNCTPAGMFPNNDELIVNVTRFQRLMGVIDVVYNPSRTRIALQADRQQIPYVTGLPMLVCQAAKSEELFTGGKISDEEIEKTIAFMDFSKKNILLIGMPGCGKTTIGRILSKKLNRDHIDLDEEIEKETGRKCADIINRDGESRFREIETEILKSFAKLSGKVISCGGGVISPKENRFIMKQNSNVIWIQRDIESLATEGRPLSQIIGTHELYRYREPLYIESCDYTFFNAGDPEKVADNIIEGVLCR